jgi:hypothetical protein
MEEELKILIKNCEERFIWYKKELENLHKDKEHYNPESEWTKWFKEHLRECKNDEEINLKEHREEQTYLRQGLNPPYCYSNSEYSKRKKVLKEMRTIIEKHSEINKLFEEGKEIPKELSKNFVTFPLSTKRQYFTYKVDDGKAKKVSYKFTNKKDEEEYLSICEEWST